MARHSMGVRWRLRTWRHRRRVMRQEMARQRDELAAQAAYQERLLRWKKRRAQLVAEGLLPDEAHAQTGPMPAPPPHLIPEQRSKTTDRLEQR